MSERLGGDPGGEMTAGQIAPMVVEILREQGADTHPVLLSVVGQRLSTKLGRSLRQVLGTSRLKTVIERSLGSMVKFDGTGPQVLVRLEESAGSAKRPIRFDPSFWAAFSKPLMEGCRRFFKASRPFNFDDVASAADPPPDRIEIMATTIPSASMPKPERDAHVLRTIDVWCETHGLSQSDFLFQPTVGLASTAGLLENRTATNRASSPAGIKALISLIEAVPAEERDKYSLPLDLVHRLLSLK